VRDRLLVRHFLQRFLDHDLISPHADRREILTVTCAMLIVSSLFLAFFLAVKYQFNLFLPPGLTAIIALDDRFFLISFSLLVMALLAVAEWDALGLDARDTAVLGPLPIPTFAIVRAKFVAIVLFAAAFDIGLSIGPTVLRALALPVKLPVTMAGALRLTLAHAFTATLAGIVGFAAVLGLRESCRAAIGSRRFHAISAALQAALVVCLITMLLLLPGTYSRVAVAWMAHPRVPAAAVPPLWFVGLHETLAGDVIDGLPRNAPPRRFAKAEHDATELYRSLWPRFHRLAAIAVAASVASIFVAALASIWNNRRLPIEIVRYGRYRALKRAFESVSTRFIVRRPAAQAGFFFTLQSLSRSAPHRVTTAVSIAFGCAIVAIALGRNGFERTATWATMPLSILSLQTLLLAAILTGFRHLVRVPAEIRANWVFQLTWSGDERAYLSGVKRAAILALVVPTIAIAFVLAVPSLGLRLALVHAAAGNCLGVLLVDALFLTYRKLPFATAFVRSEDLKSVIPLYGLAALLGALSLAAIERALLANVSGVLALFAILIGSILAVRAIDRSRRQMPPFIDFDEAPLSATQRFELTS
jgi:hypothetical protein